METGGAASAKPKQSPKRWDWVVKYPEGRMPLLQVQKELEKLQVSDRSEGFVETNVSISHPSLSTHVLLIMELSHGPSIFFLWKDLTVQQGLTDHFFSYWNIHCSINILSGIPCTLVEGVSIPWLNCKIDLLLVCKFYAYPRPWLREGARHD